MNSKNFYLHIPFCRQKCPYCKFALTPVFDDVKKRRYLEYLKKEIREYFNPVIANENEAIQKIIRNIPINLDRHAALAMTQTIYFGGGTPSVLTIDEVREILEYFPGFDSSQVEVSFESNPEDITKEYISGILNLGINRISLGVQSLNDETLQVIHRSDRESIFRALDTIQSGILNLGSGISVNIDLILGLPFSKPGETLRNIRTLHEKFPFITHTSVYMLEEGMYPKDWKQHSINEEEMQQEYDEICQYFETLGWNHYEISNWAKPGHESIHNRGYWNHANYQGFGLSATSYEDGKRWENSASFSLYYRGEKNSPETLTPEQIELEKIIFGIRTFSLDTAIFPKEVLEELIQKGEMSIQNEKIILTPAGIFRENTIIAKLIEHI